MPETDHKITMTAKLAMKIAGYCREVAYALEDAVRDQCPECLEIKEHRTE